jgi:ribonuclease BN (tRNA processing enzyme)
VLRGASGSFLAVEAQAPDTPDTPAPDTAEPGRREWGAVLAERRPPRRTAAAHRVVLLGTAGGANPKATRAGFANAVVVDDAAYLVDCGEGVHRQLWRAGLTLNPALGRRDPQDPPRPLVRALFVTHLHGDHVVDLANLVLGSWPPQPFDIYGPAPAPLPIPVFPAGAVRPVAFPDAPAPGIRALVEHVLRAHAYNINLRIADEGRPSVVESVRVHEIGVTRDGAGASGRPGAPDIDLGCMGDGSSAAAAAPPMDPVVVYPIDDRGVTVSAVLVQHAPVFPAFGFRFDTPHGSVVFSGDTGPCDNLVRLARGADVLVHEVIDVDLLAQRLRRLPNFEAIRNHLASAHSTPEQVGDVATRAGVRTLVLSHLVPGDGERTEAEWEDRVRPHFDGEVVCGVDLDELAVGDSPRRDEIDAAATSEGA